MFSPGLAVSHIEKSFIVERRPKKILDDISFSVNAGSVLCLVGPNGSGKTTLLKTLCSLLSPERGRVTVGDLDVHSHPIKAKKLLGFASTEDHSFYGRLSARMNLWFYAQLHGLSDKDFSARLDSLDAQLNLKEVLPRPFRELSSGQKQRMLLARALLHDPSVLLLDEPHQNLDPLFSIRLRGLIRNQWAAKENRAVLVSTHQLEEAGKISDQWVVLAEGRVKFSGSIDEFRRKDPGFHPETFFRNLTEAGH